MNKLREEEIHHKRRQCNDRERGGLKGRKNKAMRWEEEGSERGWVPSEESCVFVVKVAGFVM